MIVVSMITVNYIAGNDSNRDDNNYLIRMIAISLTVIVVAMITVNYIAGNDSNRDDNI